MNQHRLPGRARRNGVLIAGIAALTALTACGSTVATTGAAGVPGAQGQITGQDGLAVPGTDSVAAGDGLGTDGGIAAGPGGTTVGGSVAAGPGSSVTGSGSTGPGKSGATVVGGAAAGGSSTASGGAPPPGAAAGMPASGFGYDAKNVYIGVTLASDGGQALQAAGLNNVDPGDQFKQAQAMANYYNKRGGILGRKVTIRFDDHKSSALTAQPEVEAQVVCAKFTQDQPVVAVVNTQTLLDTPSLRACLKRKRLPLFGVTITAIDDKVLQDSAGLYFPTLTPTWNRFGPVFAESLKSRGYFNSWDTQRGGPGKAPVKVGAVIHNDPITERAFKLLNSSLAKAGHPVAEVFRYQNIGGDGSSAVLRMRSAGVTHMVGLDPNIFVFATAAESQNFRPRYGLHSSNAPGLLFEANAPKAQNNGAMGVGSAPPMDVIKFPGEITGAGKLCREIQAANGQRFEGKRFAEAFAFSICDSFRLLAEGSTAGGGFASDAFLRGVDAVSGSYKTAVTYGSGLKPGYPVLSGVGRDIEYQQSCSCWALTGSAPRRF